MCVLNEVWWYPTLFSPPITTPGLFLLCVISRNYLDKCYIATRLRECLEAFSTERQFFLLSFQLIFVHDNVFLSSLLFSLATLRNRMLWKRPVSWEPAFVALSLAGLMSEEGCRDRVDGKKCLAVDQRLIELPKRASRQRIPHPSWSVTL